MAGSSNGVLARINHSKHLFLGTGFLATRVSFSDLLQKCAHVFNPPSCDPQTQRTSWLRIAARFDPRPPRRSRNRNDGRNLWLAGRRGSPHDLRQTQVAGFRQLMHARFAHQRIVKNFRILVATTQADRLSHIFEDIPTTAYLAERSNPGSPLRASGIRHVPST